jgi:hypothetical protein
MDSDSVPPSKAPSVVSDHPQALDLDPEEEELDELNSDLDDDAGPGIERIPGESLLPSLRLESIIQVVYPIEFLKTRSRLMSRPMV